MNTRGAKLLLFGLIIMLFSLMLVFAGFVILLLNVVPAVVSASAINTSYAATGREAYIIVVLAIVAGIGGLFAAWFGLNRND